ncbi:B12-binding domain-containing radical SAM protein [bacterium]|nr:B12-binding domain-containing radical SAM protein [bacterium]
MKVLLVYPAFPETFWSFKHALKFISRKSTGPPLGLLTIAAMLPDDWELRVIDMSVERLKNSDLEWAEMVMVSAMMIQRDSLLEVVEQCKIHNKTVVAGGPLFTAYYRDFLDTDIAHFILNDGEATLPLFLEDWKNGVAKRIYSEEKMPSMKRTPVPRWDLVNLRKYAEINIQYSRGCPFECDFCDIGVLFGRKIRTKNSEQILAELNKLYELRWRGNVFFVDDNFIGNKSRLKKDLLPALHNWQRKHGFPFTFSTEASIDMADDAELLSLLGVCGFTSVFIGVETVNEESLVECNKLHNSNRNTLECIKIIHESGMMVKGGFIVGFDNDKKSIFETLVDFIQDSGIVTAMVGLLNAPKGTNLYNRLLEEGRITGIGTGNNTDSSINFIPKMDFDELIAGYKQILEGIYSPKEYYQRVRTFLQDFHPLKLRLKPLLGWKDISAFLKSLFVLGIFEKERKYYWSLLFWTLRKRPSLFAQAVTLTIYGFHFRKVFEL